MFSQVWGVWSLAVAELYFGDPTLIVNGQCLGQIQAESLGCIPWDEGTYLHLGSDDSSGNIVIEVVGLPKPEMQGSSVLWLLQGGNVATV